MSTSLSQLEDALHKHGYANLLDARHSALFPAGDVRTDTAVFAEQLLAAGIRHETKAIPFDPRPLVVSARVYDGVIDSFGGLFPLLERAIDLYLADDQVRTYFNLAPRHDELIRLGASYRPRIEVCRYDFTLDADGTPQIYELNTHCPAGATYAVDYGRLANRSLIQGTLDAAGLTRVPVPLEAENSFAAAMLTAAAGNGFDVRRVAVLNSRYLTMTTELDHITDQFRALGVDAVRCYVEDLRFLNGELRLGEDRVDLTYNKFDDSWGPDALECAFSRSTAEVAGFLDAYRAGAFFSVNSFPSMYLTEQKSMLAFLHSDLFAAHCTTDELDLIREVVPHTSIVRLLDDAELARASCEREHLVLKRSLDTRGRHAIMGRSVTDERWRSALTQARAAEDGDDWVLQALAAPIESQLDQLDGAEPVTVYSTLACFLFTGVPTGFIVRSSVEETTNVGRVGFMQVPTIVPA